MPSGTLLLRLIRGLSITFVRFFMYYLFHFLAKYVMQANEAFLLFQCSICRSPFFFLSPFLKIVRLCWGVRKIYHSHHERFDTKFATATQEKHNPSTASAASTLVRGGGISRKIIKRPNAQQTAWFHSTPLTSTHTRSFSTTYTSYK